MTISLCMIVKDEEEVLARCLDSVKEVVDEIIIVDTGSSDKTKEIASQYTNHVFDFPWRDDFAAARNFSFSKATMDYCLWLDADDVLLETDQQKLLQLKETLSPSVDIVMMKYNTGFDPEGNPTFSYYRERLIRNHFGYIWQGAVHEAIDLLGHIIYTDIAVTHRKLHPSDPQRNLRIFENQLAQGVSLKPREQFYYARELYYHQRYEDAIRVFEEFLASNQGWLENIIEACRFLSYCYHHTGKQAAALQALLQTLVYDAPRAETCCDIGKHFLEQGKYQQAVFWYELALTRNRNDNSGAFISPDCYDYLPYIQLCLCHYHMGDLALAAAYNEKAGQIKPQAQAYIYNKTFFEKNTPPLVPEQD